VEHPQPFSTDLDDVTSTLGRITEAESGWLVCENWQTQRVRLEFQRGKGLTVDGESMQPDAVPDRLRAFATAGR
jgi:hypothetical protein